MRKLKLQELGRMTESEFILSDKIPLTIVLDNIRSGHNVGSIFRTSDAYAVEKIILTGYTPRPPHKEIHKTAIGATNSVKWSYVEKAVQAITELKQDGYLILGIEQTSESIALEEYRLHPDQNKIALVLGNEVMGISDELLPLLDAAVELKQYGTKHSLNVSVCGGIVIHEFSGRLRSL